MPQAGSNEWSDLPRELFRSESVPLPPLVVVSASRGWGKTSWMIQYAEYVRSQTNLKLRWIRSRGEFESVLRESPAEPQAIFADGIIPSQADPLWERVFAFVDSNPSSMVVVSSYDRLPARIASRHQAWEVDEVMLAFTPAELRALVAEYLPGASPSELDVMRRRFRGHPYLVRKYLEQPRPSAGAAEWTNLGAPTELVLIRQFEEHGHRLPSESLFLQMAQEGAGFRRFDLSMLRAGEGEPDGALVAQFERLQASPLGHFEVDQLTGRETFEWTVPVWQQLQDQFSSAATIESRRHAYQRTLAAGSVTAALFYPLDTQDFREAERLAADNLRLFLLYTPEVVSAKLFTLPQAVLDEYPNLAILTGEFLTRAGRSASLARRAFQTATALLEKNADRDVRERYRTQVRLAYCRVALGDREGANRHLDAVLDLLGTEEDAGPVLASAIADPKAAARIADGLYLPFWTATQLDRHIDALLLTNLMRAWENPQSPAAAATHLTAVAEEIFLGFTPFYPAGSLPGMSHAHALELLEQGRGREALDLVRAMDTWRQSAPSRSTAEALVLLVRALEEPQTLDVDQVNEIVTRSRRFWLDGRASTFVTHAAALAYLALQRSDLARALFEDYPIPDWFVLAARAVERLLAGDSARAVELLSGLTSRSIAPRAAAIIDALAVAAYAEAGLDDAARLRLESMWMRSEPRLIRYALRMIPADLFAIVSGYRNQLHSGLAEVVEQAAQDPRVFVMSRVPSLSKSEMETLKLLRAGRTYAEIAQARFVSLNTVRTQVKALYRKLEVNGREDAVTKAENLGLVV